MAEEKKPLEGKGLKIELSRIALKIASRARRKKTDEFPRLNIALGLINHAQNLVGVDATKARRLLTSAKSLVK